MKKNIGLTDELNPDNKIPIQELNDMEINKEEMPRGPEPESDDDKFKKDSVVDFSTADLLKEGRKEGRKFSNKMKAANLIPVKNEAKKHRNKTLMVKEIQENNTLNVNSDAKIQSSKN